MDNEVSRLEWVKLIDFLIEIYVDNAQQISDHELESKSAKEISAEIGEVPYYRGGWRYIAPSTISRKIKERLAELAGRPHDRTIERRGGRKSQYNNEDVLLIMRGLKGRRKPMDILRILRREFGGKFNRKAFYAVLARL